MTSTHMGHWTLTSDEELVGTIDVSWTDQPWFCGSWTPTAAFSKLAPLFERQLTLMNTSEFGDEFMQIHDRICATADLRDPSGHPVAQYALHIDGTSAWFQWLDEVPESFT